MSICCIRKPHPRAGFISNSPTRFIVLLSVLTAAWFAVAPTSLAAETDEMYLKIYNLIEQADELADKAKPVEARTKYLEAEKKLRDFKKDFPTYNPKTVNYRLSYLAGKIDTLSRPAPTSTDESAASSASAKIKRNPGEPDIKLLEAGAEPRQTLRLHAKAMEIQRAKITSQITMTVPVPGQESKPIQLPEIVITANIITKNSTPDGDTAYEVVIQDFNPVAKSPESQAIADAMKTSLAALKGLTVKSLVTDRYFNKKVEVQIPPNTDPQTRSSMEQMKDSFANTRFILPEDAIGVGAKWEIKQKVKKQGMSVDETTQHEIVSMEGDTLVVKSSTTMSAANQKIPNPLLPTLKADLTKMTGTETQTATINLGKILPANATADERSELGLSMAAGNQKQNLTMKSEVHSTLETE